MDFQSDDVYSNNSLDDPDEDLEDEEDLEELEAKLYSQIYYDDGDTTQNDYSIKECTGINSSESDRDPYSKPDSDIFKVTSRPSSVGDSGILINDDEEEDFDPNKRKGRPTSPTSYKRWVINSRKDPDLKEKVESNIEFVCGERGGNSGCGRIFDDQVRYIRHQQLRTLNNKKCVQEYECQDRGRYRGCGRIFNDQDRYIRHQQLRSLNSDRVCPQEDEVDSSTEYIAPDHNEFIAPGDSSPDYTAPGADSIISAPPSPHSDSKYDLTDNTSNKLVENPFFESDCSSDSDDDGIIVLPKVERKPTEVIEIDSSSNLSSNFVSSDSEETKNDSIQIVEELQNLKRKNDVKEINKSLKKKKKMDNFKQEFGSDFEDNFCSDSDNEDEDDTDKNSENETSIKLNLSSNIYKTTKDIDKILGGSLSKLRSKSMSDIPSHWTEEMSQFYNEVDDKYIDMELEDVLKKLPSKSNWEVRREDVYGGGPKRSRYFSSKRCNNCNQMGHIAVHCPEPVKVATCHMCGGRGHVESRCPDKCCLWCGQPGFAFQESCMHCRKLGFVICKLCKFKGHTSRDCPDTWRRYHATCEAGGEIVNPGHVEKPDRDCWCSNCGKKGHLVDKCNRFMFSKYPQTPLRVISYKSNNFETQMQSDSLNLGQSKAALKEEKLVAKLKKKRSKTCPNTPDIRIPDDFLSEPSSPATRPNAFPTTLLVEKAIKKLKGKEKKLTKSKKLNTEVVRLMNVGKSKKQILAEILNNDLINDENDYDNNVKKGKGKHLKVKRIKTAISTCMSAKKAEVRTKEWKDSRGFGQSKKTESFPRNKEKNGHLTPEGNIGSRANLIPTDSRAAAKFLKKEIQRNDPSSSYYNKKIVKDLKQEVFGLKNLHSPGSLKKVERKRLADLVIQLRGS